MSDPHQILNQEPDTAGSIGRITSLADLPADDILLKYIQQALELNVQGIKVDKPKTKSEPVELATPVYLTDLLDQNELAKQHFEKFSPSQKKEYITWFEEAKTEVTRLKRLQTGMEWISEGKSRHWKYK